MHVDFALSGIHCCLLPRIFYYLRMCLSGNDLIGSDSHIELTATDRTYKADKFPHLAGCKIFTLPELPLDQVGHIAIAGEMLCQCIVALPVHAYHSPGHIASFCPQLTLQNINRRAVNDD